MAHLASSWVDIDTELSPTGRSAAPTFAATVAGALHPHPALQNMASVSFERPSKTGFQLAVGKLCVTPASIKSLKHGDETVSSPDSVDPCTAVMASRSPRNSTNGIWVVESSATDCNGIETMTSAPSSAASGAGVPHW